MSISYEDSGFKKLFSGEGSGQSYDDVCGDYETPLRVALGLADHIRRLGLIAPQDIVVLAVGSGLEAEQIKIQFENTRVIGVDLSRDMMDKALETGRIDEAIERNITQTIPEIEDNQADMVVCCGGTEFNPGKLRNIAQEMMRVIKEGGVIAITVRPSGQDEARPGYAYYSEEEVKCVFKGVRYLGSDTHVSFTMKQSDSQSTKLSDGEFDDKSNNVEVKYITLYFQA